KPESRLRTRTASVSRASVCSASAMNGNRSGSHRPTIRLDPGNVQRGTIRILLIVAVWLVAVWVVGAARHFLFLILLAWLAAIASEPALRRAVPRVVRGGRA